MTIYTDAATISATTTPSASELHAKIEAFTVNSVTQVSAIDRGPYTDFATVGSSTIATYGEYDYVHPAGSWGVFDTDNGVI